MFLSILASIQSFPCPYTFVRHGEILRKEIKIIGWLIFSRAAGATTKTAAVTTHTYGAIESLPSAFGLTLRVAIASVIASPLRVSSSAADTKRRVAATRRLTKILKPNQFANRRISTFGYDLKFTRSPSFMPVIRK
jgi:hypothetical protein